MKYLFNARNRAALTRFALLATVLLLASVVIPVAMLRAAPADTERSNSAFATTQASATSNSKSTVGAAIIPIEERKVTASFTNAPFKDAMAELCRQVGVELVLDVDGLKLSKCSIDTPVTIQCQNEALGPVVGAMIRYLERQNATSYDIFQEPRDGKLYVSSMRARTARQNEVLPDWLKPMNDNGLVVKLDDQNNVVSLSVGEKADDAFLAKLATLPKLREDDIEATKTITPAGLVHLAELPALKKLNLYEVNGREDGLGDAALKAMSQSKTLVDLSVNECGVTDEGARALAGMSQLTALSLSGNALTDAGVKHIAGLTNLQTLDLSQSSWGRSRMNITDEGMKSLSNMTQLRSLSIDRLGQITDEGLNYLSGLTQLQNFVFSGTAITTRHLPASLQSLELSGSSVTDATLYELAQYRDLRCLTLRFTSVTDAGMKRLVSLKELRQLTLNSEEITDAGLASLRALPKLESLWLSDDGVSDASLIILAEIKSLERLHLFGRGRRGGSMGRAFTVDGLLQFKKLPNLRKLELSNLDFPEGCLGLRELKQLRGLTLFHCNVGRAEEEVLKAAMPEKSIFVDRGELIFSKTNMPVVLPGFSVRITGHAVDAESGQPVQDCALEFGAESPAKPGEVIWGKALSGSPMEATGKDSEDSSHFWGESFRPGKVWARLIASGYQPTLLTPNSATAQLLMKNQTARMKRGEYYRGAILDYKGNPASGFRVYLVENPYPSMSDDNGWTENQNRTSVTNAKGRFTLSGGNGTPQKLVAISADGRLFTVEPKAQWGQEINLTLPQPATLIVHYDIPDDTSEADCLLNWDSQSLDSATWDNLSLGYGQKVKNQSEMTLTNLTPGHYNFSRRKFLSMGKARRFQFLDETNLVLKAGETQRVDIVRPVGQTVRGQVTGIDQAQAIGAYLYACIGEITNAPTRYWNPGPLIDFGVCGKDGAFQMSRFPPGNYSIVAIAFKERDVSYQGGDADFVGVAKVTISAGTPPPPVKIELHPRTRIQ